MRILFLLPLLLLSTTTTVTAAEAYVPDRWSWDTRAPAAVGMDASAIDEAIAIHRRYESTRPRDQELGQVQTFGREPLGEVIGPMSIRGDVSGVILRHGYLVAEWGDSRAVELSHSVTKTFLSTVVGLAWSDGRIRDVNDLARAYMAPVELPPGDGEPGVDRTGFGDVDLAALFESEHNRKITWDHLLRQTSDWAGTLWGKPDWADRPTGEPSDWQTRARHEPGTVFEYNDTRVNVLALLATGVWRRPLPEVLRERIMDPIGASPTWRWHGYDNSWIPLDGHWVQSVSGGGHWGGGMFIHARDMARLGLFVLRQGNWGGAQLVEREWFAMATTPTAARPDYGYMNYYLNRPGPDGRKRYPSAPDAAYAFLGNGTNMVYVDPDNDLVVVARWIRSDGIDPFLGRITDAIGD